VKMTSRSKITTIEADDLLTFRVYPENKRLHFDVFVWPSRRRMREYLREASPGLSVYQILACVLWPTNEADRARKTQLGEIHFNRQDLGSDTICHEATHAALRWARYIGIDVGEAGDGSSAPDSEELVAYAVGTIAHQLETVLVDKKYK